MSYLTQRKNTSKLKKVGTVTHVKSGIVVDYFLDGTQFVAVVFEQQFRAAEASILEQKIRDRIEHWITLEWQGIIEVKVDNGYGDENLNLKFERYYLSKGPAGSVLQVDWEVEEEHRKAQAKWLDDRECRDLKLTTFPLKAPFKNGHGHLLPYTDEVWRTLESIQESIVKLKKQINDLVTTKAGIAKLQAVAGDDRLLKANTTFLLGPGEK